MPGPPLRHSIWKQQNECKGPGCLINGSPSFLGIQRLGHRINFKYKYVVVCLHVSDHEKRRLYVQFTPCSNESVIPFTGHGSQKFTCQNWRSAASALQKESVALCPTCWTGKTRWQHHAAAFTAIKKIYRLQTILGAEARCSLHFPERWAMCSAPPGSGCFLGNGSQSYCPSCTGGVCSHRALGPGPGWKLNAWSWILRLLLKVLNQSILPEQWGRGRSLSNSPWRSWLLGTAES